MDGSGNSGSAPQASALGVSGVLSVDPEGGSVVHLRVCSSGNSGAHRIEDRDCYFKTREEGPTGFCGGLVAPRRHG